jgi:hypothetical protein
VSPTNGSFLGILEVISQFDPLVKGKEKPLYISSTICDEVTYLMGNDVQKHILTEMDNSRYYSLIVDSTY